MRRIADVVRAVEGEPLALSGGGKTRRLPFPDLQSVGIVNNLGVSLARGDVVALGAYVREGVWEAATPAATTDYVVVMDAPVADGASGRGWTGGVRLVKFVAGDGTGAGTGAGTGGGTGAGSDACAVGDFLGATASARYLSPNTAGWFMYLRTVTFANGQTPGTALMLLCPGRGAGGTQLVPVQIVSGTGEDHVCDVYQNGKDEDPTHEDQALKILHIHSTTSIPAGTWLAAWQQTWDNGEIPPEAETFWTAEYFDLRLVSGYDAAAVQFLMNIGGTVLWKTSRECGDGSGTGSGA
ncbi:MAG: hypothetical protein KBA18_09475 [Kiritimatiellae bacterium]|nr:hypothetical protein [Kiritimatiellia bacterium]